MVVGLLVFFELGKETRDRADVSCNSFLGREVRGWDPSKRWSWGKECEEVWGKLVRHLDDEEGGKLVGGSKIDGKVVPNSICRVLIQTRKFKFHHVANYIDDLEIASPSSTKE